MRKGVWVRPGAVGKWHVVLENRVKVSTAVTMGCGRKIGLRMAQLAKKRPSAATCCGRCLGWATLHPQGVPSD